MLFYTNDLNQLSDEIYFLLHVVVADKQKTLYRTSYYLSVPPGNMNRFNKKATKHTECVLKGHRMLIS